MLTSRRQLRLESQALFALHFDGNGFGARIGEPSSVSAPYGRARDTGRSHLTRTLSGMSVHRAQPCRASHAVGCRGVWSHPVPGEMVFFTKAPVSFAVSGREAADWHRRAPETLPAETALGAAAGRGCV